MPEYSVDWVKAKYKELTVAKGKKLETSDRTRAMKETLHEAISKFPTKKPSEIWRDLQKVHILVRCDLDLPLEQLDIILKPGNLKAIKSADQSWNRSSGVAFENLIADEFNPLLENDGMKLLSPHEVMNIMRDPASGYGFEEEDRQWLEAAIRNKDFDLFISTDSPQMKKVFSLVQCKSSIRDRIMMNTETSLAAMDRFFWSIFIAFDPDNYLSLPKFKRLANDNWHGFYVIESNVETEGSIYSTSFRDPESYLIRHARLAKNLWLERRHRFNREWRPL